MGFIKKYWKRTLAIFAILLVVVVALEARYYQFWYTVGRFVIVGQDPTSQAVNTRVGLKEVAGTDKLSDSLLLPVKPSPMNLQEAADYAEKNESDSLLVWQGGELIYEKYWNGLDRSIQPETASMHKTVLGLLYVIAIGEGKISPDDPIGNYIEEWRDDERGKIPVKSFLTMSSGLEAIKIEQNPFAPYGKFAFGRGAKEITLSLPKREEPDKVFWYQNAVNQIAGYALENAVGMPYSNYLSQKLWKPIGAGPAYVWPAEPGDTPRTYSSLLARPIDWLKLGLLVKDDGKWNGQQIVPAAGLEQMLSPSPANLNYGWQIWLGSEWQKERFYNDAKEGFSAKASEPYAVNDIIYFDGFGGQRVYISREMDFVIVRTGEMTLAWDDAALPNFIIKAIKDHKLATAQ